MIARKVLVRERMGADLGKIPTPKLVPSLLSADFRRLVDEVKKVEKAGVDGIHFDIADGHFVPNLTFGPMVVKALRGETDLPFHVHLMVDNPEDLIEDVIDAGGNSITFHVEATTHPHRIVHSLKDRGIRAGIAICPGTPLSSIEWLVDEVDMILIMGVNPGFGGQKFIPRMLEKIRKAREIFDLGPDVDIAVDGGISLENVYSLVEAGASVIIAGTAVFGQKNVEEAVKMLRAEMDKAYREKWLR